MSVIIKDMDMPIDCLACRIACDKESYGVIGRPPKCPLAEAPVGDLISRADAIEATWKEPAYTDAINVLTEVRERIKALPSAEAVSREELTETKKNYIDEISGLLDKIDALSAEAVQGWIPCSERLPSESDDYLCTIPLDANETYTEVLTFHKGRFYEDDDEWGATYHDDVIAWMPLPKPYKGGGGE